MYNSMMNLTHRVIFSTEIGTKWGHHQPRLGALIPEEMNQFRCRSCHLIGIKISRHTLDARVILLDLFPSGVQKRWVCSSRQKKHYNLSKKLVRSADLGAFQQSIHETAGLRFKMLVQVDHPSPARAEADPSQRYQGLEKCISQEFVVGMLTGPAGPEFRFLIVGIIQS